MNNTALRAQDILQGEISDGEIQGQLSQVTHLHTWNTICRLFFSECFHHVVAFSILLP